MTDGTNSPNTRRMLENPANKLVVAYLKEHGRATRNELSLHLKTVGVEMPRSTCNNLLANGVLVNVTPRQPVAHYAAGLRAALFDQVATAPAADVPACAAAQAVPVPEAEAVAEPPPKWVGIKAPPRCYDVMRAPPYRSGQGPAMRPGADDFLRHASHGARC